MGVVDRSLEFLEKSFSTGADYQCCWGGVVAEDEVDEVGAW